MNPRDRYEPDRHDAQPDRPHVYTGGARPVPPTRETVSRIPPLELPTDEEREQGRAGIEAARAVLRGESV